VTIKTLLLQSLGLIVGVSPFSEPVILTLPEVIAYAYKVAFSPVLDNTEPCAWIKIMLLGLFLLN
jgi:hypothetical protein